MIENVATTSAGVAYWPKQKIATTTKQSVIEMIQRLPDDVTWRTSISELCFHQKVDEGLRQLDVGEGVDHEEAKKHLSRWLS